MRKKITIIGCITLLVTCFLVFGILVYNNAKDKDYGDLNHEGTPDTKSIDINIQTPDFASGVENINNAISDFTATQSQEIIKMTERE